MNNIIYHESSDGLAILFAADCGLTIEQIAAKDIPQGAAFKIADSLDIDLDFLAAYDFCPDNGAKLDIPRAKDIQRNRWRSARIPLLAALDVAFMRAVEIANEVAQASIAAKKQALRDVTTTELPEDLAAIKATWPSILIP